MNEFRNKRNFPALILFLMIVLKMYWVINNFILRNKHTYVHAFSDEPKIYTANDIWKKEKKKNRTFINKILKLMDFPSKVGKTCENYIFSERMHFYEYFQWSNSIMFCNLKVPERHHWYCFIATVCERG